MIKPIWTVIFAIALIGGAGYAFLNNCNNRTAPAPTDIKVVATWKGKNITLDNIQDVITKVEEMLLQAEDVYTLSIPSSNISNWKKNGFVVDVTFSEYKKILIPALSPEQTYEIKSIIIVDADNIPGYIIVSISDENEYILAFSQDELQNLKVLCGIK